MADTRFFFEQPGRDKHQTDASFDKHSHSLFATLVLAFLVTGARGAGIRLETYQYPFPVEMFAFESQRQQFEMAFMDLAPEGEAKGAIVLLHGKNFSGAYWEETAKALAAAGYRIVMPDQIGFGKSSKPEHYQFSFAQLAANTHALLTAICRTSRHSRGSSHLLWSF